MAYPSGRKSADSWLPVWPEMDPEVAPDHDSFEGARDELIEELTCQARNAANADDYELSEDYYDAIEDVKDWPATDTGAWSIEVDGRAYYIEHVEGGAYGRAPED